MKPATSLTIVHAPVAATECAARRRTRALRASPCRRLRRRRWSPRIPGRSRSSSRGNPRARRARPRTRSQRVEDCEPATCLAGRERVRDDRVGHGPSTTLARIVNVTVWPASTLPSASFEVLVTPISGHEPPRRPSPAGTRSRPGSASPCSGRGRTGRLSAMSVSATTWTDSVAGGEIAGRRQHVAGELPGRSPLCDSIDQVKRESSCR